MAFSQRGWYPQIRADAVKLPLPFDVVCDICRDAFFTVLRRSWDNWVEHLKVPDLLASTARGCHTCHLLCASLCNEIKGADRHVSVLRRGKKPLLDARIYLQSFFPIKIHLVRPGELPGVPKRPPCGFILHSDDTSQFKPELRPRDLETSITQSARQIQRWLDKCRQGHLKTKGIGDCPSSKERNSGKLPTRLLEITSIDSRVQVRLVLSKKVDAPLKYITLSYCWGGAVRRKLTMSNYRAYRQSIPLDPLPQTLKDAIMVTKELGVRHLWIDSLCIIQNSKEDWRTESAKMGDVYANSFINLAADASSTSKDGLFRKRNPLNFCACKVTKVGDVDQEETKIYYRDPLLELEIHSIPLYTRAWAVQERILPPRTVHFGADQLRWDCASDTWLEGNPYQYSYYSDSQAVSLLQGDFPWDLEGDQSPLPDIFDFWNNLVKAYSRTNLSHASDKLVAIAGLASRFIKAIGCLERDYLAGLWRGDFIHGLLWSDGTPNREDVDIDSVEFPYHKKPYKGQYRAPSWSWASIDSIIEQNDRNWRFDELAEIQHVEVSCYPLGQLTGGFIHIKGPLCRATVSWLYFPEGAQITFADGAAVEIYLKMDNRPRIHSRTTDPRGIVFLALTKYTCEDEDTENPASERSQLVGIYLEATKAKRGQYRRLGHWKISWERQCNMMLEQAATAQMDESLFVERDEEGRCTVELI